MNPYKFAKDLCEKNGHTLLYLTRFGSHLYGTDTEDSDEDFKGLFLPNKTMMLLGDRCKSLSYHSGDDVSRNTSDDLDIELWSIQYYLENLGKGETNSIDLLFSFTNPSEIVYYDQQLHVLFNNPLRFFDPKNCNAFIGYAIGQAKKYGIKGSRLGIIKQIYEWLEEVANDFYLTTKLYYLKDALLNKFYDPSYCFEKEENGEKALVICGKVHLNSITFDEFYNRIKREYDKYGDRAKKAENNEGIDWKALSHAVRSLDQMTELLIFGKIKYPLFTSHQLKQIKNGEHSFKEVEDIITTKLEDVQYLQEMSTIQGKKDNKLVRNLILNLYNEKL